MLGLYYSGIIVYNDVPVGIWGIVYIFLFLAIFTSGYFLTVEREEQNHSDSPCVVKPDVLWKEEIHHLRPVISIFAAAGIVAALLFSYEMLFLVGINPLDLLSTRDLYLEREATIYSRVASVLGMGGFFSLVSVILCWEFVSPLYRVFWLLSPALLSVFSVFSAGRQTVLQLVLIPFFTWSVKRTADAKRMPSHSGKIIFIFFALLVLGYGMITAFQRNIVDLGVSKKDYLMEAQNAQLHPILDETLDYFPPVLRDGIAELIVYFSHEVPNYLAFWELPGREMNFGLWELPFLARRLNSIGLVYYSVEDEIKEEYARFEMSGRYSQVWQTVIRDLILDFGLTGTLFMAGMIGYLSGRVYSRFKLMPSLYVAYLLVGINLWCACSIMFSVVSDTLVFFYIVIAILLYLRFVCFAQATSTYS